MTNPVQLAADIGQLSLPDRMRIASDILIDAAYRFTGCSTDLADQMTREVFSAKQLGYWADIWEAEDAKALAEEAEHEKSLQRAADQLARDLYAAIEWGSCDGPSWLSLPDRERELRRLTARKLIDAGWIKVGS